MFRTATYKVISITLKEDKVDTYDCILKLKQNYHYDDETPEIINLIIPDKYKSCFQNIHKGELLDLKSSQFEFIKDNFYNPINTSIPLKSYKPKDFGMKNIDMTDLELPTYESYQMSWDMVIFQNNHVIFCSPYAESGGKGKRISWDNCSPDFEKIKLLLAKKVPYIIAKIIDGNVIDILNFFEITQSVISLTRPTLAGHRMVLHKEHIAPLSKPKSMFLLEAKNLPEVKSSKYLRALCEMHEEHFPVYYCIETKNTLSGNANSEKAFIFCPKIHNKKMLLVYENVEESRSTYIFETKKNGYTKTIQKIHQFFASDVANKRENMAFQNVDFGTKNIYLYYRIFHTDFFQWKSEIISFIKRLEYPY